MDDGPGRRGSGGSAAGAFVWMVLLCLLVLGSLLMGGCASPSGEAGRARAPRHPALQADPPGPPLPTRLIAGELPVRTRQGFRISPDGRSLAWQEAGARGPLLAVGDADTATARQWHATAPLALPGPVGLPYHWLGDSRHLVVQVDPRGDEATRLLLIDTARPHDPPRDLTPWPGRRSVYAGLGPAGSGRFYFLSNRRDPAVFDLWEGDAEARTARELRRNDRRVLQWLVDAQGRLAGWIRPVGDAPDADRVVETFAGGEHLRFGAFDTFRVHRLDPEAGTMVALSNLGRDRIALEVRALADGQVRAVLAEDALTDLDAVWYEPASGRAVAAQSMPDRPRVQVLAEDWRHDLAQAAARLAADGPLVALRPGGSSRDGRRVLLRPVREHGEAEWLLDRPSGRLLALRPVPSGPAPVAAFEPIRLPAGDGLTLHGYLLRPRGASGRVIAPAPMVVSVHGGPWSRDAWHAGADHPAQWLASRGYAVLMVNYRGSSGYGRAHLEAAIGQLGGATQDDIAAAVRWAVARGVADPAHVAVMGASFGGYATLMQLIREPALYACGIDIVGVANWPRLIEQAPPWWADAMHHWRRHVGDPADPAQREAMLQASPVRHLDRIRAPLLVIHGADDVRVSRRDADEVVAGLRARGAPVDYLLIEGEGHVIRQGRNRMAMWRRIEGFLGACLGGAVADAEG